MSTTTLKIHHTTDRADLDNVADLIARSFADLPACAYLVPTRQHRLEVMRAYFAILVQHAARHGAVNVTADLAGVAVWFDRTRPLPEPPDYARRQANGVGQYLSRFLALDQLFDSNHPQEPHWHLPFLAVDPGRQGEGIGSALLEHTHRELDAFGTGAYLEATNATNRRLYQRHGYVDMNPCDIHLPDGTPFYRMWRPPQPR